MQLIRNRWKQKQVPDFAPGDTVVVQVKVKEGTRERLQAFEGVVIGKRNRGVHSAFTVRKNFTRCWCRACFFKRIATWLIALK